MSSTFFFYFLLLLSSSPFLFYFLFLLLLRLAGVFDSGNDDVHVAHGRGEADVVGEGGWRGQENVKTLQHDVGKFFTRILLEMYVVGECVGAEGGTENLPVINEVDSVWKFDGSTDHVGKGLGVFNHVNFDSDVVFDGVRRLLTTFL